MKIIVLLASLLLVIGCADPDSGAHWGYSGNEGPQSQAAGH